MSAEVREKVVVVRGRARARRGVGRGVAVAAAAILGLFGLGEAVVRVSGAADVPLFRDDPLAGYLPQPNQHGAFLRKNRWVYNERGLGGDAPFRPGTGVLLVGDSVANGGNQLDQPDKLGPQLAQRLHVPVWTLASGGWALENELQALKADPTLLDAPTIVFVSNSGDFGVLNRGDDTLQYPRKRPASALVYVARRVLLRPHDSVDSQVTPEATARWRADLAAFLRAYRGRLVWVLYPQRPEVGSQPKEFATLLDALNGRAEIVTPGPGWTLANYRDFVHPNARGDAVLAERIAETTRSARAPS